MVLEGFVALMKEAITGPPGCHMGRGWNLVIRDACTSLQSSWQSGLEIAMRYMRHIM